MEMSNKLVELAGLGDISQMKILLDNGISANGVHTVLVTYLMNHL